MAAFSHNKHEGWKAPKSQTFHFNFYQTETQFNIWSCISRITLSLHPVRRPDTPETDHWWPNHGSQATFKSLTCSAQFALGWLGQWLHSCMLHVKECNLLMNYGLASPALAHALDSWTSENLCLLALERQEIIAHYSKGQYIWPSLRRDQFAASNSHQL